MSAPAPAEGLVVPEPVVIPTKSFSNPWNRASFEQEYGTALPEHGHRFSGEYVGFAVGAAILADGVVVAMNRRYETARDAGLTVIAHDLFVDGKPEVDERILLLGAATREQAISWLPEFVQDMNAALATMAPHVTLAMPPK